MNGAGASGLKGTTAPLERERPNDRDGEAAAALWVALAQRAISTPPLPEGQIETPSAWHPGAGDLTPGAAPSSAGSDAASDPQAPERMVLHVDGGELGELSVTLERESGALRVVIGLENEGLVSSVLPDARALKSALEGAGLNVHALNVVPASEVGTVLAQRRLSPTGRQKHDEPEGSEQPPPPQADKRNRRRLTLIG